MANFLPSKFNAQVKVIGSALRVSLKSPNVRVTV